MKTTHLIKDFIISEVNNNYTKNDLADDVHLLEEGIIDSLGIMKLLSFLEEQFQLQITEDELIPENFESINTIASLIDSKTL